MADGEQLGQRHERFVREQLQMMINRPGDEGGVAGRRKRGINLGHAFLEPQRPETVVPPEQQMRVFVEDNRHVHRGGARFRQGKHDEIFVIAVLEEAGEIFGLAVVERQERFHRFVVGKGQHHNRRRGDRLRPGQQRKGFTKLLQLPGGLVDLLRRAATVDVEMRGARLEPLPLHQRNVIGAGRCRREKSGRQRQNKNDKTCAAHEPRQSTRRCKGCHSPG